MINKIAVAVGRGIIAGLAGTAAMTLSTKYEMQKRNREASMTPITAASKVLKFEPVDEAAKTQLNDLVHWSYGTGWGVVRGLLSVLGIKGVPALLIHYAMVWGTELVMLPSLKVVPPVNEWPREEVKIDAGHHVVYAVTTSLVFALLNGKDG